MTKLRQLWLLTALGSVAVLAGGHFLLVSPKTAKAAALREEAATQQDQNESLRSQIQMLNRQKKELPKQQAELERFAAKIPNNPALPALIRSLSDAADNAGVEIDALSPGPASVVAGAPTAGATAAGAPVTAAAGPTGTTLPLAAIPITVKITGNYSEVSQFFSEVERLPRAFLLTQFAITGGATGGAAEGVKRDDLTVTMTGRLYMTIKAPAAPRPQPAATTVVD